MEFVEKEGRPFGAVINPALVDGASLSGDIGESKKAVEMVAAECSCSAYDVWIC